MYTYLYRESTTCCKLFLWSAQSYLCSVQATTFPSVFVNLGGGRGGGVLISAIVISIANLMSVSPGPQPTTPASICSEFYEPSQSSNNFWTCCMCSFTEGMYAQMVRIMAMYALLISAYHGYACTISAYHGNVLSWHLFSQGLLDDLMLYHPRLQLFPHLDVNTFIFCIERIHDKLSQ